MTPLRRLRAQRFEVFLALLLLASAVSYLAGVPRPGSINALLPGWVRLLWGAALLVGSLLLLVGLATGRWRIEFVGLLTLAWPAVVYALAAFVFGGLQAAFPGGASLVLAAFCTDRALELRRAAR